LFLSQRVALAASPSAVNRCVLQQALDRLVQLAFKRQQATAPSRPMQNRC
jgi:hypothetical protein